MGIEEIVARITTKLSEAYLTILNKQGDQLIRKQQEVTKKITRSISYSGITVVCTEPNGGEVVPVIPELIDEIVSFRTDREKFIDDFNKLRMHLINILKIEGESAFFHAAPSEITGMFSTFAIDTIHRKDMEDPRSANDKLLRVDAAKAKFSKIDDLITFYAASKLLI